MGNNVESNGFPEGADLVKAAIASAVIGAASVIGADLGRTIMVKIHDWKDKQKSSNFGFSK